MLARVQRFPLIKPSPSALSCTTSFFIPSKSKTCLTHSRLASTPALCTNYFNVRAGRHPVITNCLLQMSKPPQPSMPHHIRNSVHGHVPKIFPLTLLIISKYQTHTFCIDGQLSSCNLDKNVKLHLL